MNKTQEEQPNRWFLKFDDDAQETFNAWWEQWEYWIREESLPEYLISHFTKYRKLIPSLALIIYLLSGKCDCYVDKVSLLRAIKWCEYLKSHAFRIYGQAMNIGETTSQLIAERILKKELPMQFTLRELYRNNWSGINKETSELGLQILEEIGWGKLENLSKGNKPSVYFSVNPKVFKYAFKEVTIESIENIPLKSELPIEPIVTIVTTQDAYLAENNSCPAPSDFDIYEDPEPPEDDIMDMSFLDGQVVE